MAAKMERTRHPGIYRRGSRYVAVGTHRGRQHKSAHGTLAEAIEAKGRRAAGDTRPTSREASRITPAAGSAPIAGEPPAGSQPVPGRPTAATWSGGPFLSSAAPGSKRSSLQTCGHSSGILKPKGCGPPASGRSWPRSKRCTRQPLRTVRHGSTRPGAFGSALSASTPASARSAPSRAPSSPGSWPIPRTNGDSCSSCLPKAGCGSARRSDSPGRTWSLASGPGC
jgi:hypothetical protein